MSNKRMLRPLIVLILATFLFSSAGFGQIRRHDLSLSYGFLSIDQSLDLFGNALSIIITLGTFAKDNVTYTGVPFLTYHYSANSRFGFGAAIGGYSSSGTMRTMGSDVGTFKERNYIAGIELDYHWVMRENLQLYSGAGFGIRFRHGTYVTTETESSNDVLPTFHLNALGVRVGKKIAFFGEFGIGYKGMILAGINGQF